VVLQNGELHNLYSLSLSLSTRDAVNSVLAAQHT
jgi:hypothetical protein